MNNYGTVGGVISLQSHAVGTFKTCDFENNIGFYSGGVIYVTTESYFTAISCEFIKNYANETSTIDVLGGSNTKNITIESCNFESNSAIKNTLSFMHALVKIKDSQFLYNTATLRTKNIFCGFSEIYVERCQFKS